MNIYNSVLQAVGRTPLIRLSKVSSELQVTLLAKVESLNPGGSIKDRIGVSMVEEAERQGLLKPGGTIIEATAGNTGVGLALVAAVKGYRCIFVLPDKMSEDKVNLLRGYGAQVILTPTAVPPDSPDSYNGVADRLARDIPGAFRPNQFTNSCNPQTHYQTTGPEIWQDTEGKVDVLVAGIGTGGTISGTGQYLKEQNPEILVVGADPQGSILSGDTPRPFLVEGIGEDFIPLTYNRQVVDDMVRISDSESFHMARRLAREEGLLVGGSAGTAVAAAVRYSQRLATDKVVVVVLPDTGRNYLTKLYFDPWMREHGFLHGAPTVTRTAEVLAGKAKKSPLLVSVSPDTVAMEAVQLMERHEFSQLPVLENGLNLGNISEMTLMRLLHDGRDLTTCLVRDAMAQPLPEIDEQVDLEELTRLLLAGHGGVLITRRGSVTGFLSRSDLIHHWTTTTEKENPHG